MRRDMWRFSLAVGVRGRTPYGIVAAASSRAAPARRPAIGGPAGTARIGRTLGQVSPPIPPAVRFATLVALYLLGAELGVWFITSPDQVSLIWAPAGIGYAALLLYGLRWWPFIAVSVLLMHAFLAPVPLLFVPYSVAANVLGALAGAGLVRYFAPWAPGKLSLATGLTLLLGGMSMVLIGAPVGVFGMVQAGMVPAPQFWQAAAKWALGDLFGLITVTPVMLLWVARHQFRDAVPRGSYAGWRERLLWGITLVLFIGSILWAGKRSPAYVLGLASLPMAQLLWSALRFDPLFTSVATAGLALFVATLVGLGAAGFSPPASLLESAILLGYMCIIAMVPQMLSAATHENRIFAARLLRRASTDALTGLPNRQAFEDAVRATAESADPDEPMALAYLDLDQFKIINDIASHAAGDQLLCGLVGVLRASLPSSDLLARIGGDEFGVLMRGCPGAAALARAQMLRHGVAGYRLPHGDHVLAGTVSIGLVPFRPGHMSFPELLASVDAACFTAKELGGNRVQMASVGDSEVHRRTTAMRWAMRLQAALEHDHFELYCQSIVPLRGDGPHRGRHFEVLLRLRNPDDGDLMLPGEFIPAAERFHLAPRLDRYVVEHTLRFLESRGDALASTELCCINLSAGAVLDEEFGVYLRRRISASPVPAQKLCFELTETSAVRELARAQAFIQSVRALGCRFALDDFGTGFCSFAYLRALDVDFFKIDGSFVRDVAESPLALAIVRSIADIGRVMSKATIAECVETEESRARLLHLGVDYAQGYAISEPRPMAHYFASASLELVQPVA